MQCLLKTLHFPGLPMRLFLVGALVFVYKLATRWRSTLCGSSTRVLCITTSPPALTPLVPPIVRTCNAIWKPFGLPLLLPRVISSSQTGALHCVLHHAPSLSTSAYRITVNIHSKSGAVP